MDDNQSAPLLVQLYNWSMYTEIFFKKFLLPFTSIDILVIE